MIDVNNMKEETKIYAVSSKQKSIVKLFFRVSF